MVKRVITVCHTGGYGVCRRSAFTLPVPMSCWPHVIQMIFVDALMSTMILVHLFIHNFCGHESITQDPDGRFANALMTRNSESQTIHHFLDLRFRIVDSTSLFDTRNLESQTVQHILVSEIRNPRQYISFSYLKLRIGDTTSLWDVWNSKSSTVHHLCSTDIQTSRHPDVQTSRLTF